MINIMEYPLISVVMPVFNGETYLDEAIGSVLSQSYNNFEFLIIDDGSTDSSLEIIEKYDDKRILVYSITQKKGIVAALNLGLSNAKGKYIVRQDADDISLSYRFETQVKYLEENNQICVLGSSSIAIDSNGKCLNLFRASTSQLELKWQLLFHNPINHPSAMIRSEFLKRNKLNYFENEKGAEDFGLWSRMSKFGNLGNVGKPLIKYRLHENQVTSTYNEEITKRAVEIALNNINSIYNNFSFDEVQKLRNWYYFLPTFWKRSDIELLIKLLLVGVEFSKKIFLNSNEFLKVFRKFYDRLFNPIYFFQPYLWNSKIWIPILKIDLIGVFSLPFRRVVSLLYYGSWIIYKKLYISFCNLFKNSKAT
jgi:glycosyltransferase involved in cell wall biosynthesis